MCLIELSDYTIPPTGSGQGLKEVCVSLSSGDVWAVECQYQEDAYLFIQALATLIRPAKGTYRFNGQKIDLTVQRESLACKKKIGYIGPDAALISNLTIRQNLLLMRYYFGNDLTIDLDDNAQGLCRAFGIETKMHKRPAELNAREVQAAVVIREIIKNPELLLLINPEEFIGHENFELLTQLFNDWIATGKPVVFHSYDRRLVRRYAKGKFNITHGALTTIDVGRLDDD
jgi:putative ABC transport system ATP-binding protein